MPGVLLTCCFAHGVPGQKKFFGTSLERGALIGMNTSLCLHGFRPLPVPETEAGKPRRCGVEIEFSGLDEGATARLVAQVLGGSVTEEVEHFYTIDQSTIGRVGVELDTRFAKPGKKVFPESVLDAARTVVPVEIVTAPLLPEQMDDLVELIDALKSAGAKGTGDSLFAGFGIHFNPEVVGFEHPHTLRTIQSYALLESWLRAWRPLDLSRRVLPFVAPWPEALCDALVSARDLTLPQVMALCKSHLDGRNHGLDLLPLLHAHDAETFDHSFGAQASGARPAFHFRLPDCRLDEAEWSITQEWDRWWLVEALAADTERFARLREAWQQKDTGRRDWTDTVSRVIGPDGERLFS